MRIAVIGSGHVGKALGAGWARAGHTVVFGRREAANPQVAGLLPDGTTALAPEQAVAVAEVVALAVPWSAVPEVLRNIAPQLDGKILIDCTNPGKPSQGMDHSAGSGGEQVAQLVPRTKVVKAFNTTGFENMQDPAYPGGPITMFCAGDDPVANKTVLTLAQELGFDAIDVGGLSQCRTLEMLAMFWGTLAYGQKLGRNIGFRLVRRVHAANTDGTLAR